MRWVVSTFALALAISASAAIAQTQKSNGSAAPSAQSSGAGIPGQPGTESGPGDRSANPAPGIPCGLCAHENPTVQQQDPSNIKGLPGNKSGPAAKHPSRQ